MTEKSRLHPSNWPPFWRQRRWQWTLGGLVLLMGVAAALPSLLQQRLQALASEQLGRPVQWSTIRLNPMTLAVAVEGLTVGAESPGQAPLLAVERLGINLSLSSLWHRAPVLDAVQVEAPQLVVRRLSAGHYSIDDLLHRWLTPPAEPAGEPARYAVYNLTIHAGRLRFDDLPAAQVHEVAALELAVPFVSTLDAQDAKVRVEPRLSFRLDGSEVDGDGGALPFAEQREGELRLAWRQLDLARLQPYWPRTLPVQPAAGRLDLALQLAFKSPATGAPALSLSGQLDLNGVRLLDAQGAPLLAWQSLHLPVSALRPLERQVHLGQVRWQGAQWQLGRDRRGRLSLATAPDVADRPLPPVPAASAASAAPAAAVPGWQVQIDRLQLVDHTLQWRDEATSPRVALALRGLGLEAKALRWPWATEPATLSGQAELVEEGVAGQAAALAWQGQLAAGGSELQLSLGQWPVQQARAYLAGWLRGSWDGRLSASAQARWDGAPEGVPAELLLKRIAWDDASVRSQGRALLAWRSLALDEAQVDLAGRRVQLGQLSWQQPRADLSRDAAGRLNLDELRPPAASAPAAPAATGEAPWRVEVRGASLSDAVVRWRDAAAGPQPVDWQVDGLALQAGALSWPAQVQQPWALSGRLRLREVAGTGAAQAGPPGQLSWRGQLAWGEAPRWQGQLLLANWPLQLAQPYLGDRLPVRIVRAGLDWRGQTSLQWRANGPQLALRGDARLQGLRLQGAAGSSVEADDLLSWRELVLPGVDLQLNPGQVPRLGLGQVQLNDFYASLVVTPQGQLNLNDLRGGPIAAAGGATAAPPGEQAVTAGSASAPAAPAAPAASVAGVAAGVATATAPPVQLTLGGVRLTGGRVDFVDHFIRPNYSAAVSELAGELGAYRWEAGDMATLALAGKVAGTGQLKVAGRLNPVGSPLALDLRAQATDLELSPLSPYAAKYAGYAIQRGKLAMDVQYRIEPDGQLQARNQVVLKQLDFGDRVDSPEATRLPVQLAVALLKDRDGVIDLDLPISGSINDPQFSLGGVVLKVIVNLLTKALTAPFALLSGGGDDLSHLAFLPGQSVLPVESAPALDRVAKALADRPALHLTITGEADLAREREGLQAAWLDEQLRAEARRFLREEPPAGALAPALRESALRRLYDATALPGKPRNLIGLSKSLPPDEMASLLRQAAPLDPERVQSLALRRAEAVRDALLARGLANERLFLASPAVAPGTGTAPGVALSLGTR